MASLIVVKSFVQLAPEKNKENRLDHVLISKNLLGFFEQNLLDHVLSRLNTSNVGFTPDKSLGGLRPSECI